MLHSRKGLAGQGRLDDSADLFRRVQSISPLPDFIHSISRELSALYVEGVVQEKPKDVLISWKDSGAESRLRAAATVLSSEYTDNGILITALLDRSRVGEYQRFILP